jgi:hypothetical protein
VAVAYASTRSSHHLSFLLGDRAVEAGAASLPPGSGEAFRFHARGSGRAQWVALFVDSPVAARTVEVGLYGDARGHPGRLLGAGTERAPAPGKWNHIRIHAVRLARGKAYWLAVLSTGGPLAFRHRVHGSCESVQNALSNLMTLRRRWRGGHRSRACPISAAVSTGKSLKLGRPVVAVTPPATPIPVGAGPSAQTDCVAKLVSCGYPAPTTSGVPAGTALTPSGSISVNTPGTVVSHVDVTGTIDVYASNVTITDTQVTTVSDGDPGIVIHAPATNATIEDSTIAGPSNSNAAGLAIHNTTQDPITVKQVYIHNASDGVVGLQTTSDSYIVTDGIVPGAHVEPVYIPGGNGPSGPETTVDHNTLLDPQDQVAAVFGDDHAYGTLTNVTVDGNLMAGGDYVVELGCAGDGEQNISVENNRFSTIYYRNGGQYGSSAVNLGATAWSGNVWDATLRAIMPESGTC